jgi:S1-C subfamily serine protease
VPSTGRAYSATVVGYSLSGDVAVLKLANASGLQTATVGDSAGVKVGDRVTAVGNAGGRGGSPTVTTGTVTGLHRSITVGDTQGGAVRLADLIGTNASLEPGDSGGPLLDRAGRVIGMDTAADTGFDLHGGSGFAIPIGRALTLVKSIERGRTTATVHVGPTSFLGISVSSAERAGGISGGALVSGVLSGSPADDAGLESGDVITSIAGRAISSPTALVTALLRTSPGQPVQVRWSDQSGFTHSRTVRPVAGPPQ